LSRKGGTARQEEGPMEPEVPRLARIVDPIVGPIEGASRL